MGAAPIIDLDGLLAPIGENGPVGADLRQDASPTSLYYRLKDARSAARAAERAAEADGGGAVPAEWRTVASLGAEALAGHAKDLEVAAWLCEALLRLNGFAGLRDGFALLRGLVERYWDELYPLPDEDGLETRLAPLVGLNDAPGALVQPSRKVLVTGASDPGPFAAWQFDVASDIAKIADDDRRAERLAAGAPSLDQVLASARATPIAFYRDLLDDLAACAAEFAALEAALGARCGADAPAGGAIREVLEAVAGLVRHLAGDRLAAADSAAGPVATVGGAPVAAERPAAPGVPQTRDQAFASLAAVADWFRRNEPQSLVPAMLDNVIRRGRMSVTDLLAELVPDHSNRNEVYTRAGIQPPDDG